MAAFECTATVMGAAAGSDHQFVFAMDRDPATIPADEIVEAFARHLHDAGHLHDPNAYELNSVIRKPEKRLVMAIGHLRRPLDEDPFLTMINY